MSVRPCVVYGPHDYSGRLDYWLRRVDAESDREVEERVLDVLDTL